MKKIIIFTLLLFLFTGCNKIKSLLQDNKKSDSDKKEQVTTENQELPPDKPNSDNELRKKELELKEKELELKEKELDIEKNKNDSREDTRRNTSSNSFWRHWNIFIMGSSMDLVLARLPTLASPK